MKAEYVADHLHWRAARVGDSVLLSVGRTGPSIGEYGSVLLDGAQARDLAQVLRRTGAVGTFGNSEGGYVQVLPWGDLHFRPDDGRGACSITVREYRDELGKLLMAALRPDRT